MNTPSPPAAPPLDPERLVQLVVAQPEAVGIAQLEQALGPQVTRRTLQRQLAALVQQGRIRREGKARAVRYAPGPASTQGALRASEQPDAMVAAGELSLPLSSEGLAVRALVRRPRQERLPVSYQTAFIEQYQPNHSAYLPTALREQLHAMGRAPRTEAPAGTFARDILDRLLIDLSWASSRLEGNTYSRLDTERLIEWGQAAAGKDALETQMILNHKQAIEYLVQPPEPPALSTETLIALHALLSDGLMADPLACGRLRNGAVEITGSVYLPLAFGPRIEELFGIVAGMAAEIGDPFEQAFFLMVHLPYLQPFADINKRVSRLAANIPFIRHNLCPLSFVDVPKLTYSDAILGVYELNRIELLRDVFVWAYERSCQQYAAVRQALVPPDPLRLRYRQPLSRLIAELVRSQSAASPAEVQARIPAEVPVKDRDAFVDLVLAEFRSLHPGNAVRFGLRPLELELWQQSQARPAPPA